MISCLRNHDASPDWSPRRTGGEDLGMQVSREFLAAIREEGSANGWL